MILLIGRDKVKVIMDMEVKVTMDMEVKVIMDMEVKVTMLLLIGGHTGKM